MFKARHIALAVAIGAACLVPVASRAQLSTSDSIFHNGAPRLNASPDSNGVELGLRFSSHVSGQVTGIRFYKRRDSTGPYVGSLYSARGQLLASARFGKGDPSGWQTVSFANPVTIAANRVYVAAYYAPHGHYALTADGLARRIIHGPLIALSSSDSQGNGLYAYASSSTFPLNQYRANNYWVDIRFVPHGAGSAFTPSGASKPLPATVIGPARAPNVTCTRTIKPSTTIQSAVHAAPAGSTICLSGDWTGAQNITATAPSSNVTVAAAPGDAATVAGLSIGYGKVSNLTFEGIHFTGGISMSDCASNLRFLDNNFQNISDQSAFYMYYGGDGDSNCSQTGITMEYNQIDHTGECLEVASNTSNEAQERGINFSHNVCGPDIGYGCVAGAQCNVSGHYVQMSNTENDEIDNNVFLGPVDPRLNPTCNSEYSHVNVFHETGSSKNLDFSNNIIWHTQACGETILFQSGSQINDTINNNLLVEDRAGNVAVSYNLYGLDGVTFNHNTTVAQQRGGEAVLISGDCTDCGSAYTNPQNVTADYNLTVDGHRDYAGWSCTGTCNSADNVSDDSSARVWGPATGSRDNWKVDFRSTSWSPNSGLPWSPPPAGYYRPANRPSADGYQGAIGP